MFAVKTNIFAYQKPVLSTSNQVIVVKSRKKPVNTFDNLPGKQEETATVKTNCEKITYQVFPDNEIVLFKDGEILPEVNDDACKSCFDVQDPDTYCQVDTPSGDTVNPKNKCDCENVNLVGRNVQTSLGKGKILAQNGPDVTIFLESGDISIKKFQDVELLPQSEINVHNNTKNALTTKETSVEPFLPGLPDTTVLIPQTIPYVEPDLNNPQTITWISKENPIPCYKNPDLNTITTERCACLVSGSNPISLMTGYGDVFTPEGEKPYLYPNILKGPVRRNLPTSGVLPNQTKSNGANTNCYVPKSVTLPPPILENELVYPDGGDCSKSPAIGWNNGNLVQRGLTVTQTLDSVNYSIIQTIGQRYPNTL